MDHLEQESGCDFFAVSFYRIDATEKEKTARAGALNYLKRKDPGSIVRVVKVEGVRVEGSGGEGAGGSGSVEVEVVGTGGSGSVGVEGVGAGGSGSVEVEGVGGGGNVSVEVEGEGVEEVNVG